MDDYKAEMWSSVYPNMTLHKDITFRENSELGLMMRKNNPLLKAELNRFIGTHKVGKDFAKVATAKYFDSIQYAKQRKRGISKEKFQALKKTFNKYAKQYELDPLILMAQAYQESRLKAKARSHVGARGIMQLMPATGREMKVGNINNTDANIHAGTKYHKLLKDHYFSDKAISEADRTLFIFAGYNAGPNKINRLRKKAQARGLNPNVWFDNVELIAAEVIGRETVQYIQNIYNYYVSYTMMRIQTEAKLRAKLTIVNQAGAGKSTDIAAKAKELKQELSALVGAENVN